MASSTQESNKREVYKQYALTAFCEFIGTFFFLFCTFTAISAMKFTSDTTTLDPTKLLFVGATFGLSLCINVWIFYRITGGVFNPALTWGLVLLGKMPILKGVMYFIAQTLAGIVAAAGAEAILPGKLNVSCGLAKGVNQGQGLMLEALLTAELMLTVLFLAVEKHRATPIAPLVIGCTIAILHFISVPFTGASLNPARAFGPAIVEGTFDKKHWIFWIGPLLGATFGAGFYYFMTEIVNYKTLNPGQDFDRDVEIEGAELKRQLLAYQASTSSTPSTPAHEVNLTFGRKEDV
ncbi:aquaporin-like protein [Ascobolus immersus RN42]|uniref:Aquaporin-like protein n=1 Tax=Ascobolus immersus RN42 TaxID=1160509 RepID=A0A3N4IKL3_ASCIM|nr:aquaporin-like protein [Ascobolus immersus RN42]